MFLKSKHLSTFVIFLSLSACKITPQKVDVAPTADKPSAVDTEEQINNEADEELSLTTSECKDTSNLAKITLSPAAELFITDAAVLNDVRAQVGGKWSFSYAMREILELPVPGANLALLAAEHAKVLQFINKITGAETVNTFPTAARPSTATSLRNSWKQVRGSDGKMYFTFAGAPFRLAGIVNRMDIVKKGEMAFTAGEGRFIFGFTGSGDGPMTVIVEYNLPIGNASPEKATRSDWVRRWHSLKSFLVDTNSVKIGVQPQASYPTPLNFRDKAGYLRTLQAITERFANRKARVRIAATASTPPILHSALAAIRTNELSGEWAMREIVRRYGADKKALLVLTTLKNDPHPSFKLAGKAKAFAAWINSNVICPLPLNRNTCFYNTPNGQLPNSIPVGTQASPLLTSSEILGFPWFPDNTGTDATSIKRRFVALNTCGGCHLTETPTGFLHLDPLSSIPSTFVEEQVLNPRTQNFKNLICLSAISKESLNLSGDDNSESSLSLRLDYTFNSH